MKRASSLLVTAIIVAGCVHEEANRARIEADTATLTASTRYVWMTSFEGDRGGLSYAVPETDDGILSFGCLRSSGRATITAQTDDGDRAVLVLWEGDRAREWPAELFWDDAAGGHFVVAEISLSEPALASLRHAGEIWIGRPAIGPLNVASAPERREVERFFAFCDR